MTKIKKIYRSCRFPFCVRDSAANDVALFRGVAVDVSGCWVMF